MEERPFDIHDPQVLGEVGLGAFLELIPAPSPKTLT